MVVLSSFELWATGHLPYILRHVTHERVRNIWRLCEGMDSIQVNNEDEKVNKILHTNQLSRKRTVSERRFKSVEISRAQLRPEPKKNYESVAGLGGHKSLMEVGLGHLKQS